MRTETRTYEVYNLHELTREAQAKAHNHWAEHFDYGWADENEKTLQAFEGVFNIKVNRWSYDSAPIGIALLLITARRKII